MVYNGVLSQSRTLAEIGLKPLARAVIGRVVEGDPTMRFFRPVHL